MLNQRRALLSPSGAREASYISHTLSIMVSDSLHTSKPHMSSACHHAISPVFLTGKEEERQLGTYLHLGDGKGKDKAQLWWGQRVMDHSMLSTVGTGPVVKGGLCHWDVQTRA